MVVQGEAEPSLRELAKRLDVSPMALYRHFPNKAALLDAVVDSGFADLHTRLLTADEAGDGATRLIGQGMAYIDFASAHPSLFRLMFTHRSDAANNDMARHRAFGLLQNRVDQWLGEKGRQTAQVCWALAHGLAMLQIDGALALDRRQTEAMLQVLIQSDEAGVSVERLRGPE